MTASSPSAMCLAYEALRIGLVFAFRTPSLVVAFGGVLAPAATSASLLPCVHPAIGQEFPLYGDINGSGVVNVADSLCAILASFWQASGSQGGLPTCIADDPLFADLSCDSTIDTSDVVASITLSVQGSLSSTVDSQGRGCYDACTSPLLVSPNSAQVMAGQASSLSVSGGVPPYGFQVVSGGGWVTGAGVYTAPAAAGSALIRVSDAVGGSVDVSLSIYAALVVTPPAATVGVNQSTSFSASGGLPPYTFTVPTGGGSVTNTGLYSAPATGGTATVRVTDSANNQANASVTISSPLAISPSTVVMAPSSTRVFSGSGGTPPYVYSVVSGGGSFSGSTYTAPSSGSTATVRVADAASAISQATVTLSPGSVSFTTSGTHSWTVPVGVTVIRAVVVGGGGGGAMMGGPDPGTNYGGAVSGGAGGGLSYRNNISVTPGQVLSITVGAAGASGFTSFSTSGNGSNGGTSQIAGILSATGGTGGRINNALPAGGVGSGGSANRTGGAGGVGASSPGGGGGAAGYTGNGGAAATTNGGTGSAGAGGGGGGGSGGFMGIGPGGGAGGGVGLFGVGANGAGGVYVAQPSTAAGGGGGGSGGTNGGTSGTSGGGIGGAYGGGGSGGRKHSSVMNGWQPRAGGGGAVRVIWGTGKSFPNSAN